MWQRLAVMGAMVAMAGPASAQWSLDEDPWARISAETERFVRHGPGQWAWVDATRGWSLENDPLARIARDHAVEPAAERLIGGFDCAVDDMARHHYAGGGAGRIG